MVPSGKTPRVSVVVLNYNGARWIDRCLASLRRQTGSDEMEVIVADNQSSDGSDKLAEQLMSGWPSGQFTQNGGNLGYCEGNNRGARLARGDYLLFLNNDAWLEDDCLEQLMSEVERTGATAATPRILDYDSDNFQSIGASGFDLFGLATSRKPRNQTSEIFMPEGCSYLIKRSEFFRLGEFDPVFFMYADELDLSWRVWLSGGRALAVPQAKLHHRGAAQVNPAGQEQVVEFRTSDTKRHYANRNNLLVLLKNGQHLVLFLAVLQTGWLILEGLVGALWLRRWSFFQQTVWRPLADIWRRREYVLQERSRLRPLRVRSDFWMLRFWRWRLNRWDEILRVWRLGLPKVTPARPE